MLNIVKISGKPGSGKTELLGIIAAGAVRRNYLVVSGGSTAAGIAQAVRGSRDLVLCIDECPASLLDELQAHPELGRGNIKRVYAVVDEPVTDAKQEAMQEFSDWFKQSGWTTSVARGAAWEAWQASRAAVVVELPDPNEVHDSGDFACDVIDALEAAGVKVAP
jgi:hypothetical protein